MVDWDFSDEKNSQGTMRLLSKISRFRFNDSNYKVVCYARQAFVLSLVISHVTFLMVFIILVVLKRYS